MQVIFTQSNQTSLVRMYATFTVLLQVSTHYFILNHALSNCEDKEYVDGSAISSVCCRTCAPIGTFSSTLTVTCIYFRGNCSIDQYILNQSVFSVVP